MKSAPVQAPVKSRKRRWAEIGLGIFSGLFLGLPLLAYSGIRKISGNKLPGLSAEIKKGAAIGLAVAVSMFGTIFSGGFAAPAVPAIIAGILTAVAGVGGVVLLDKRADKQQKDIQTLQDSIAQLHAQQSGRGQGLSQAPGATQSVSLQQKLSQALRGATKSLALQQRSRQALRNVGAKKTLVPQQRSKFNVLSPTKAKNAISEIVKLEARKAVIGGAEGEFSASTTSANKMVVARSDSKGK